jgi:endoribonuclease Dicer
VFEEQTQLRVGKYCGEVNVFDWEHELATKQVLVFTSGLFLNLLKEKELKISDVSVLMFDEAHHAAKNHPLNVIMKDFYYTCQVDDRPSVFGMTASPASSDTFEDTWECVLKLCTNLDSEIASPTETIDSLKAVLSPPNIEYEPVNDGKGYDVKRRGYTTF